MDCPGRRHLGKLVVCLTLAGCVAPGEEWAPEAPPLGRTASITDAQMKAIRETVAYDMKDPDSVQFRNMAATRSPSGVTYVCGEVNARNGFGGYVGFSPFYGMFKPNGAKFNIVMMPGSRASGSDVHDACRKAGIR